MARERTRGTAPKGVKDPPKKTPNKAKGGMHQPIRPKPNTIAERMGGGKDRYPHRKKAAKA